MFVIRNRITNKFFRAVATTGEDGWPVMELSSGYVRHTIFGLEDYEAIFDLVMKGEGNPTGTYKVEILDWNPDNLEIVEVEMFVIV